MENIIFRAVRPDDAREIAAIYNHYVEHTDISFETEPLTDEAMRRRICELTPQAPYIVCEDAKGVAGYAYAHLWKERAAYRHTLETTVYLRPDCLRRGIGGELMQCLINECRQRGVHALVACITGGNTPSIALHHRLGFVEVSHFTEVGRKHGRWLDVIDMQLTL